MQYVFAAIGELKFDTWAKYLPPEVLARMRAHYAARGHEWGTLITDVQAGMQRDPESRGQEATDLARRWLALFHDMVGTDPDVVANFRSATATEPLLRMGPGISDEMIAWLRRAMPGPKA
jgi:hypothetical protein